MLLTLGPDNYWIFERYEAEKTRDFQPEDAQIEGFDIPLKTTPLAKQFDAPGGLQKKLGDANQRHGRAL